MKVAWNFRNVGLGEGRVKTKIKTCGRGIDGFMEQGYIWPCFYFDSLVNIGAKPVE